MNKQYIYAGTAILFWSTVATVTKLLLKSYTSIQVLWISSFFAFLILWGVNTISGNIKNLRSYTKKDFVTTILIGIPGTLIYYLCYYAGADILPASQAFIINYMWPIMSVFFAWVILGEKMTVRKIIAIVISFLGVGIVTGTSLKVSGGNTLLGVALCLMGAVSYGVFTGFNQKYSYDKKLSMMINYLVTFVFTTVINLTKGDLFIPSAVEAVGFAWNGMLTMAVASTAWIIALSGGNTAKISNLAYITPFLSLVWTGLILKENISVYSFIGLAVIVTGIFVQLDIHPHSKKKGEIV